jgi:SAM-dependent methyltransferase
MEPKPYLDDLKSLEAFASALPQSRLMATATIMTLAQMNMRWERIMVDREFPEHPWPHAHQFVRDAEANLRAWHDVAFIGDPAAPLDSGVSDALEERHHDLFQDLWVNFSEADYTDRVERYAQRLRINDLADGFLNGMRAVDFGCGHGNFAHALLNAGAQSVLGIDYGEKSIRYASAARDRLGVAPDRLDLRVASVYDCPAEDGSFDFAIQNGVFHHLDDEDAAYREVHRVLRPGGWFWIYTDGAGAVSHDLWDASVRILKDIPHTHVVHVLDELGVETNKRYHLGDGLNAVYRHTTYDAFVARLNGYGFEVERRLTGGYPTDFDADVIAADPWGVEKFGDGDIRLLVRKS